MPRFYILQKQKVCYLLLGKNISFARFTLILVLKTVIWNKFMSTGVIIDDEFSWRPLIIGTCKTVSKILYNLYKCL